MSVDYQAPPWWKNGSDDYTKSRSAGVDYTMDDLIGRVDVKKYTLSTNDPATVSGTDGTVLI